MHQGVAARARVLLMPTFQTELDFFQSRIDAQSAAPDGSADSVRLVRRTQRSGFSLCCRAPTPPLAAQRDSWLWLLSPSRTPRSDGLVSVTAFSPPQEQVRALREAVPAYLSDSRCFPIDCFLREQRRYERAFLAHHIPCDLLVPQQFYIITPDQTGCARSRSGRSFPRNRPRALPAPCDRVGFFFILLAAVFWLQPARPDRDQRLKQLVTPRSVISDGIRSSFRVPEEGTERAQQRHFPTEKSAHGAPLHRHMQRSPRHIVVVEKAIGAARKRLRVRSAGLRQPRLFDDCPRTIDCTSSAARRRRRRSGSGEDSRSV